VLWKVRALTPQKLSTNQFAIEAMIHVLPEDGHRHNNLLLLRSNVNKYYSWSLWKKKNELIIATEDGKC